MGIAEARKECSSGSIEQTGTTHRAGDLIRVEAFPVDESIETTEDGLKLGSIERGFREGTRRAHRLDKNRGSVREND